nr:class II aldolase/adducin family protein [Salinispora arenicola]
MNPAGYAIHSAIHAARPDVVAAAHTHSVYGRAWAALGRQLDPLTQDACVFAGSRGLLGLRGGRARLGGGQADSRGVRRRQGGRPA